jgi:NAD-dependent DNA ligase
MYPRRLSSRSELIVARGKYFKLIQEVIKLRYLYHVLKMPAVTDEVYDWKKSQLIDLEFRYPDLVKYYSPTKSRVAFNEDMAEAAFTIDKWRQLKWTLQYVKSVGTEALGENPG